jgi:hypothetical protein
MSVCEPTSMPHALHLYPSMALSIGSLWMAFGHRVPRPLTSSSIDTPISSMPTPLSSSSFFTSRVSSPTMSTASISHHRPSSPSSSLLSFASLRARLRGRGWRIITAASSLAYTTAIQLTSPANLCRYPSITSGSVSGGASSLITSSSYLRHASGWSSTTILIFTIGLFILQFIGTLFGSSSFGRTINNTHIPTIHNIGTPTPASSSSSASTSSTTPSLPLSLMPPTPSPY